MKRAERHSTIRYGSFRMPAFRFYPLVAVLVALLLAVASSPSVAGNPHSAFYSSSNDQIFWFIHASDSHVGASGSTDSANLQWLVSTAKNTIKPSFIVVSGDLTDSTNGNIFGYPNGPYQAEWDQYKSILATNNVTSSEYYDIPGNHDAYNDKYFAYYLNNSVQGRATGRTQHSWTRTLGISTYHFLGVNTADNTGAPFSLVSPYGDHAGLDSTELGFITSELKAHQSATLTMVFGHHPLAPTGNSSDTYIYYGRDEFVNLMNSNGASLYGYGHTHVSSESFYTQGMTMGGVFYFNVSSIGKDSPNQYTVTAIDCNGIASVTQTVGTWPVVLITAPMDRYLGGNVNPYTYSITNSATNPIRALVFEIGTVSQVQYRVDAGTWNSMTHNPNYPYLWEATWNASALTSGEHTIDVQATTSSGTRTDSVRVNMQSTAPQLIAGVSTLQTGKYAKRTTLFSEATTFKQGDSIVFRAFIKDSSSNQPIRNATATISISGPQSMQILTGPSDSNGFADGIWKTSAPNKRGSGGTQAGNYTSKISGVTASGYTWDRVTTSSNTFYVGP